jgi:hypothetical protein
MNRKEAGILGWLASKAGRELLMKQKIEEYNFQPKLCFTCETPLSYKDAKLGKIFCNSSCSAKNKNRKIKGFCLNCLIELDYHKRKFCSRRCNQTYNYKKRVEEHKLSKRVIRRYLTEKFGYKCSVCNLNEWNCKPLVLEIEHKDGNSENDSWDNLCYICPNCHSQTPTYKSKNKGNGRHSRRLRYKAGKSF